MGLSAAESVGDAVDLTREFARPLAPGRWLRLLALALLVSGGGATLSANVPPLPPTLDPTYRGPTADDVPAAGVESTPIEAAPRDLMLAAGAVALAIGIAFALLQALAEFAFVEALRSDEVSVRASVRRHWRRGLGLLAFRLGLIAVAGAAVVAVAAAALAAGADPLEIVTPIGGVAAVVAIVVAVVDRLTALLVVPIAIEVDCGVLAAWRRLRSVLADSTAEILAFAVVQYVLGAVLAGVTAAALVAVAVALAALVALVGVALAAVGVAIDGGVGLAVLVALGVLALLGLVAAAALVQVPIQAYLRYYGLLVLGDVAPEYDLVPDRRRRVRDRRLGVPTGDGETGPAER